MLRNLQRVRPGEAIVHHNEIEAESSQVDLAAPPDQVIDEISDAMVTCSCPVGGTDYVAVFTDGSLIH